MPVRPIMCIITTLNQSIDNNIYSCTLNYYVTNSRKHKLCNKIQIHIAQNQSYRAKYCF